MRPRGQLVRARLGDPHACFPSADQNPPLPASLVLPSDEQQKLYQKNTHWTFKRGLRSVFDTGSRSPRPRRDWLCEDRRGRTQTSVRRQTHVPQGQPLEPLKAFLLQVFMAEKAALSLGGRSTSRPCELGAPGVAGVWPAGNRTAVFIGAQQRHPWGHQPQASPQNFPRRPSDGRARGQCLFPSLLSGLSAPSSDLCRGHDIPEQGGRSGKSRGSKGEVTQGGSPGVPAVFSWRRPGTAAWPWISPHYGPSLTPSDFQEGWGLRGHSGCPWPGRARRGRG